MVADEVVEQQPLVGGTAATASGSSGMTAASVRRRWPPSWTVLTAALAALYLPVVAALAAWVPSTAAPACAFCYGQLAWSKLALWLLLMPGGFAYVALGPYNERRRPFASRKPGTHQMARLLAVAAAMFWAAPLRALAAPGDANAANLLTPGWPATLGDVVLYNYVLYVVPFLAGCNYWFLDRIPTLNRMFYVLTWPPRVGPYRGTDWLVLAGILGLALGLTGFHLWALAVSGLLVYYGPVLLAAVGALGVGALVAPRFGRHFHLHHYFIFGALLLFTPFQNPVSAVVQGALAGFFVEGVASWGMAALFPLDA